MQKGNLVFVINSLEGGGAEKALSTLLAQVAQSYLMNNFSLHLVLLDDEEIVQDIPDDVRVHILNAGGSMLKSVIQLRKKLKEISPEIVVSYLTRANCASILVSKMLRFPVLVSERVSPTSHFSGRFGFIHKFMMKILYPLANQVVAVSEGVKVDLIENFSLRPHKISVLYNAYDSAALQKKVNDGMDEVEGSEYIVSVGRLVKNKNFELLIRAYAKASLPCRLLILGQGPEMENLETLIADLGLQQKVELLGYKINPYPYVANAKFFVSSSNAEGFPNAIAEALVLGRPVISTNCQSGPAEILAKNVGLSINEMVQEKYGLLVPVNDEYHLAQALKLFFDEDVYQKYKRVSAVRGADFSLEKYLNDFSEILGASLERSLCG